MSLFPRSQSSRRVLFWLSLIALFTPLSVTCGQTTSADWRQQKFGSSANSGNGLDTADPDKDNIPNLLEYALNLEPLTANGTWCTSQIEGGNFTVTYTRRKAAAAELIYTYLWSTDLGTSWNSTGVTETPLSSTSTTETVKASLAINGAPKLFLKLQAARIPVPATPVALGTSPATDVTSDVSWTDVATNETGYRVERKPSGGTYATVATLAANSHYYHDTGLTAGVQYFYRIIATNSTGDSAPSTEGQVTTPKPGGLQGDYFNNETLTPPVVLSRVDPTIDFEWNSASPGPNVNATHFSTRWTGQVLPEFSETYTFYSFTDDGARLWVNGTQLVNDNTYHGTAESSGQIVLNAGEYYSIVMEYFQGEGGDAAHLSWSSASRGKQIIPENRLYLSGSGSGGGAIIPPPPAVAITPANAGFETPSVGSGIQYGQITSGWDFGGGSGVTGNNSPFTQNNPPAPQGTQVGFLQGGGAFSQALPGFVKGATYALTFAASNRAGNAQTWKVLLGTTTIGTFAPTPTTTYTAFTAEFTTTVGGTQTLTFQGTNNNGGDNTVFIDNVALTPVILYPPLAPAGLLANPVKGTQVNLAWTDLAINETSYIVQRAPSGGPFATIASLPAGSSYYFDTTAAVSTAYIYQVCAVNSAGTSDPSNTVALTTPSTVLIDPALLAGPQDWQPLSSSIPGDYLSTLQNSQIQIDLDLRSGSPPAQNGLAGGIRRIIDKVTGRNTINIPVYRDGNRAEIFPTGTLDSGRGINECLYRNPAPWNWTSPAPNPANYYFAIGDNPNESGDGGANSSRLVNFGTSNGVMYTEIEPNQWGGSNIRMGDRYKKWVAIEGNVIKTWFESKFNRTSAYGGDNVQFARTQEAPCYYSNGSLSTMVFYDGATPYTGDATRTLILPDNLGMAPSAQFLSENWIALIDPSTGRGMGIIFETPVTGFGQFDGKYGLADGSNFGSNYVNWTPAMILDKDIMWRHSNLFVVGTIAEIRAKAYLYGYWKQTPEYRFNQAGRQLWTMDHATDPGYVTSRTSWPVTFNDSEGSISSPALAMSGSVKQFYMRYRYTSSSRNNLNMNIRWFRSRQVPSFTDGSDLWSQRFPDGSAVGGSYTHQFPIQANAGWQTTTIDMSSKAEWKGVIAMIQLVVDGSQAAGETLDIEWISGNPNGPPN